METDAQNGVPEPAVEGEAPSSAADELAKARALADERYSELQYARAEIDNVRKRAERIALERLAHGRKGLLGKFLPVLDNLQRALSYDDSQALREGLNATLKGFEGLLQSERVRPIEVVGKPFDPRLAEAIGTRESAGAGEGTVLEEAQRGYMLDDDLLRPALVIVAAAPEPSAGG